MEIWVLRGERTTKRTNASLKEIGWSKEGRLGYAWLSLGGHARD